MRTLNHKVLLPAIVDAALLTLTCAAIAQTPQEYLPLDTGNRWSYQSDLGATEVMTITGECTVLGVVTRVRLEDYVTDMAENYWTTDEGGSLFLHGARNLMDGFQVAYQPPIRMIDAPLSQGKAWATVVRLFDMDGTPWGGNAVNWPFVVDFVGNINVPAGSFSVFGVGYNSNALVIAGKSGVAYDIFGRRVVDRPNKSDVDITEWYAAGVGIVQKTPYADEQHPLQLTSFGLPTALRVMSWGSVKAEYRSP